MTEDMHGPKLMTDKKGYELSHYIMAERCLQVEYSSIMRDLRDSPTSETLIYILEGGFKGFHKYSDEQMIEAYKEAADISIPRYTSPCFAYIRILEISRP